MHLLKSAVMSKFPTFQIIESSSTLNHRHYARVTWWLTVDTSPPWRRSHCLIAEDMNVSSPLFAQNPSLIKAIRLIFPKAVGVIAKLGSAVRGFKVGDRVGYMMFTDFCGKTYWKFSEDNWLSLLGTCPDCFAGEHRYCKSKGVSGFADPYGGFSEYALADPASTLKLPDDLDFDV